jgi:hypothetical protein
MSSQKSLNQATDHENKTEKVGAFLRQLLAALPATQNTTTSPRFTIQNTTFGHHKNAKTPAKTPLHRAPEKNYKIYRERS